MNWGAAGSLERILVVAIEFTFPLHNAENE